jgi:hypothetical protein
MPLVLWQPAANGLVITGSLRGTMSRLAETTITTDAGRTITERRKPCRLNF